MGIVYYDFMSDRFDIGIPIYLLFCCWNMGVCVGCMITKITSTRFHASSISILSPNLFHAKPLWRPFSAFFGKPWCSVQWPPNTPIFPPLSHKIILKRAEVLLIPHSVRLWWWTLQYQGFLPKKIHRPTNFFFCPSMSSSSQISSLTRFSNSKSIVISVYFTENNL